MNKNSRLLAQLIGYGAAVCGVALTTACIGVVEMFLHIQNLLLAYLLIVLLLAVRFGRGPAVLASLLAFLSYDFFFIPPAWAFAAADWVEWLSVLMFLVAALVIGHLTATVQAHAAAALASQQRTARLYALAQLMVSTPDQETLFEALTQHVVQSFAANGVTGCVLVLPDANQRPQIRAAAVSRGPAWLLSESKHLALAEKVFLERVPACLYVGPNLHDEQSALTLCYVPLISGDSVIGALGIAGTPAVRVLAPAQGVFVLTKEEAEFFTAFCGQITLALEQVALRQAAIHAEALRESERLKQALLESVTHDLSTPLTAIKAATTSLLEPGMIWHEAQRVELINAVDTSVDRLVHLVRNLLDISRLEAGADKPARDWHFIGDLMVPVLEQLRLAGQPGKRQIVVDIPESIPPVPLDHRQIERVLINLLENALKYSPPESVIQVRAGVIGSPPELEVCVTDRGIGIQEDELEAIFEKFYRVPQVHIPWAKVRPTLGSGLGLAICSNIIRGHEGRIWAESRPGEGSTFHFTLPLPLDRPEGALPELDGPIDKALTA